MRKAGGPVPILLRSNRLSSLSAVAVRFRFRSVTTGGTAEAGAAVGGPASSLGVR